MIKSALAMQRTELIGKCWDYLLKNFHKFDEKTKIQIALELAKKDMPTDLKVSGDIKINIIKPA